MSKYQNIFRFFFLSFFLFLFIIFFSKSRMLGISTQNTKWRYYGASKALYEIVSLAPKFVYRPQNDPPLLMFERKSLLNIA